MAFTLLRGAPRPLGATPTAAGINVAVHAPGASAVTVCLFDRADDPHPAREVSLWARSGDVWHGELCGDGLGPGTAYGLRVDGPWAPARGLRFNPHKLLVDPWARALTGGLSWDDALRGSTPEDDDVRDERDSAPLVPRSLVVDTSFDWRGDSPPAVPWTDTLIYEAHVGLTTARHPEVPEALRGTYLGLACEPVVEHIRSLGVTAVELLPIHAGVSERHLVERGLTNVWGYNSLGFLAPDARFASGDDGRQVAEVQELVRRLHAAGLEVILDVVYNHTAEADHQGPTLSLRGLDNPGYYHLSPDDPRFCCDTTGCGNSVDASRGPGLQLIMDSLRHWVETYHVDGFRFDLAATLGRASCHGAPDGRFFEVVAQDPLLSRVKLIAEPWDLGTEGYLVGGLPSSWSEWNGRWRDVVRGAWRGDPGLRPELASRLAGSSDFYAGEVRGGVHFVTCHDGFTLADLVSYESKHNQANGEDNRDGSDHNLSRNWGAEGPSDDPAVRAARLRARRNLVASLLLSQGVPMLLAGDELSRSQGGNNNAYCQQGPGFDLEWALDDEALAFLEFVRHVSAVRREHPVLRRRRHFSGSWDERLGGQDITWLGRDGAELLDEEWHEGDPLLAAWLRGRAVEPDREEGPPGDLLLVLLPAEEQATLPLPDQPAGHWTVLVHTGDPSRHGEQLPADAASLALSGPELVLLRHDAPADEPGPEAIP